MKISPILVVRIVSTLAGILFYSVLLQTTKAASWVTNGPLHTARYNHSVTVLPNGKVLIAGGLQLTNGSNAVLSSVEIFDPATGTSTISTNSMGVLRCDHTATLLPNGKVLVAGGSDGTNAFTSSELYDPATGTWKQTDALHTSRFFQTATLLLNGKVLCVGGTVYTNYSYDFTSSAELYNPITGTWATISPMTSPRVYHTATLLPNGQVLVAGGHGNAFPASVELYDPTSETWTNVAAMHSDRLAHTATLLPNGKVLVVGGIGTNTYLFSAEVYDPAADSWTITSPLTTIRRVSSATLLPNGRVLAVGRPSNMDSNTIAEIYDPITEAWVVTDSLVSPRMSPATLLPNGKVLLTGGAADVYRTNAAYIPLSSTELYDSANGAWKNTGVMNTGRAFHTATLLPDGRVLCIGGEDGNGTLSRTELFNPNNGSWLAASNITFPREYHTATLLPNGNVFVTGGSGTNGYLSSAELYHPSTGTWTLCSPMTIPRQLHTATLLPSGKVLVAGGLGNDVLHPDSLTSTELYDPATDSWKETGEMTNARWSHTATLMPNGKVLIAGGARFGGGGPLSAVEIYDPSMGRWTATAAMINVRRDHAAALLASGKVMIAGGYGFDYLSSVELFDPNTETWTTALPLITARTYHTLTLLPSGDALAVGGYNFGAGGALFSAELYDPASNTWRPTGSLTSAGLSFHTATLLSNGKLLITGGRDNTYNFISNPQLYNSGGGFSNSWQPQVTTFTSPLSLGSSLVITGSQFRGISGASGGSTQDSSSDYPLVQLRSIESGQTMFLLTMNWSTNAFTSLPVWIFPPGYALATVFVNGIPSTSSIVNLTVPVPTPPTITDARTLTNGTLKFSFANSVGAVFGALASTNLSLPLSNWTALSGVTEISPGQFQFTDPQATNSPQRFYRVRAN